MASYVRKIQVTGGSTYIVSLPSKWVRQAGIGKGDNVKIDESETSLVISKGDQKPKEVVKSLTLKSAIDRELLLRALTSIYISNFDTLTIKSQNYMNQQMRDTIKHFTRLVMGIEIFEESSKTVVLQNVLDFNSFPVPTAVRRMALNVKAMLEDTMNGIASDDSSLLENVINRDDEVDRYQLYVYREASSGEETDNDTIYYLIFSRILERIADHSVNICKIWINRPDKEIKARDEIVSFLDLSLSMYNSAVEGFYSSRFERLNEIISGKGVVNRAKENIVKGSGNQSSSFVALSCAEECSRIGLYATDIAELAMDLILNKNPDNTI
ncbi:MAG: AbrB/MazE/SpoVT family DNA-binding domain-containing protein [Candidatus Thermoplasmatota archaeon]|nr:AbrB/MazE/SpoVT family DNA-binding domain-containing protein [Candidatus Thermoplasmatota archaeon]